MQVFTCNDHDGHWPVGTASVIVANDEEHARELLKAELKSHHLNPDLPFTLERIDTSVPSVTVLCDGEY